jgi:hypothetical protein
MSALLTHNFIKKTQGYGDQFDVIDLNEAVPIEDIFNDNDMDDNG